MSLFTISTNYFNVPNNEYTNNAVDPNIYTLFSKVILYGIKIIVSINFIALNNNNMYGYMCKSVFQSIATINNCVT